MRKSVVHRLGNPRILRIHFHTLRHWKATIEYARTKDILYVQQLPRHRDIKYTLKYIQPVNMPQEEKFICKVAKDSEQATELIELGFEFVARAHDDGSNLFLKKEVIIFGVVVHLCGVVV